MATLFLVFDVGVAGMVDGGATTCLVIGPELQALVYEIRVLIAFGSRGRLRRLIILCYVQLLGPTNYQFIAYLAYSCTVCRICNRPPWLQAYQVPVSLQVSKCDTMEGPH